MRYGLILGAAVMAILGLQPPPEAAAGEYFPECGPPQPRMVEAILSKPARGVARIEWTSQSGYFVDIVRGSLERLQGTQGDYQQATERCLLDDSDAMSYDDQDIPPEGDGFWYLLRTDQKGGCLYLSVGYNAGDGSQVGSANAEIQASGRDCTCYVMCMGEP